MKKRSWTNRQTILILKYCMHHRKDCMFSANARRCRETRIEEYQNRKNKKKEYLDMEIRSQICRECKVNKTLKQFYRDPSTISGINKICRECKKIYDKQRHNTWEVLIKSQWRKCLYAHGNTKEENPLSFEDCTNLLKKQEYKCNHCSISLTCEQGSVINANYNRASLDRTDSNVVGYGNGNAQWLCVSCNKGKCTMPNEIHKERFASRDRKIKELENEIVWLKSLLFNKNDYY